ncbi:MAG: alpha/beta fold hydrolase BchO [Pseudomonadota bacterium]
MMDWERERQAWPYADHSQFVPVDGTRFHVQIVGEGTGLLLLHGSGATTHSWEGIISELSKNYRVITVDLPGHGFTEMLSNRRATLSNVSTAIHKLLNGLDEAPEVIIGHSAGAAIAAQMIANGYDAAKALVSINGAFYPFPGFARELFPAIARVLFLNPFTPKFFAATANKGASVDRLIASTGSRLDEKQVNYYRRAFCSSHHVEGTLAMMANWDLTQMEAQLKSLDVPVLQIIGEKDGTIDPKVANRTHKLLKDGLLKRLNGYGHLVHEEVPELVTDEILNFLRQKLTESSAMACAK